MAHDAVCLQCKAAGSVLNGVCCRCTWHVREGRPATLREIEDLEVLLDNAVADAEVELGEDYCSEQDREQHDR